MCHCYPGSILNHSFPSVFLPTCLSVRCLYTDSRPMTLHQQHGETDCWPMDCPQLTCQNAVQEPGDCCPRCVDTNPCANPLLLQAGGRDSSTSTCVYMGTTYGHGDTWVLETDPCTSCECKVSRVHRPPTLLSHEVRVTHPTSLLVTETTMKTIIISTFWKAMYFTCSIFLSFIHSLFIHSNSFLLLLS